MHARHRAVHRNPRCAAVKHPAQVHVLRARIHKMLDHLSHDERFNRVGGGQRAMAGRRDHRLDLH
jgi:hypothetical protein